MKVIMSWKCKTVFYFILSAFVVVPAGLQAQASTDRMVSGEGYPGFIAKWAGTTGPLSHQIANSNLYEDTFTRNIGLGTTSPTSLLHLYKDLSNEPKVGITIQGSPFLGSGWFIGSSNYSSTNLIICKEQDTDDPIISITNEDEIYVGKNSTINTILQVHGGLNIYSSLIFKSSMVPKKIIFQDFKLEVWQQAFGSQHKVAEFSSGGLEIDNHLQANTFTMLDGAASDYILRCDGSGNASWTEPDWMKVSGNIYYDKGNVGVGTSNPLARLQVDGNSFLNGNLGIGTAIPQTELHIKKQSTSGPIGLTIENAEFPWFMGINKGFTGSNSWFLSKLQSMGPSDTALFVVTTEGKVGIGVNDPAYTLDVKGNIRATEVKVMHPDDWYDKVFDEDYNLLTIEELRNYINCNGHLPGMPTGSDVADSGIEIGIFSGLLLQKIEELTLHIINQDQKIRELENRLNSENQNEKK